jgi:cytidylate kinase
MLQLRDKGDQTPFEQVLEEVNARDWQDTHREADPLRQAEDAKVVDNSHLTREEQMEVIYDLFKEAIDR